MTVSEVILQHTFTYLDALDLTHLRVVCSYFKEQADESMIWSELCRALWGNKQNHPWEQWVRVSSESVDEEEMIRHQIETILLYLLLEGRAVMSQSLYDSLVCLKFIRIMSKKREAAPICHYVREEQIRLEHQLLNDLKDTERDSIRQQIIGNIETPVNITSTIIQQLREENRLLTWRESYIASVVDSTRCCLSYAVSDIICFTSKFFYDSSYSRSFAGRESGYRSLFKWGNSTSFVS